MILRYAILENDIVEDIIEIDKEKNLDSSMTTEEIVSSFFPYKKIILETKDTGNAQTSWIYRDNKFYMPSPYPSWVFKDGDWNAPKNYPQDGNLYMWEESISAWKIFNEGF